MKIAIVLFERITALDAIGPYEVLSRLPGAELCFVGLETGVVRTDNKVLGLSIDRTIEDMPNPDILLIPGGYGVEALMKNDRMLDWVRKAHETSKWTTSVCTGSLLLAAAGVLEGLPATTHWAYLDRLEELGARPVSERVVHEGKVVTAAGVSSGIDMALTLTGKIMGPEVAQMIQLGIEYDPEPPFNAGSVKTAPPAIVDTVRGFLVTKAKERAQEG